jgi:hypothetical protein
VFALVIALEELLSTSRIVQKELQSLSSCSKWTQNHARVFILFLNAIAELRWELNDGSRSLSLGLVPFLDLSPNLNFFLVFALGVDSSPSSSSCHQLCNFHLTTFDIESSLTKVR